MEQADPAQLKTVQPGLSGAAGVLRALRIMGTCMGGCAEWIDRLQLQLSRLPVESAGLDVFSGVSGLMLECRDPVLLRRCADRLLSTKTLQTKDGLALWDPLGKGRAISGMGHGMAGIGLALVKAYGLLGDARYLDAARDAFAWEHGVYSENLGTWPDLRTPGAPRAMHGYCSGAPGIGLALLGCAEYSPLLPNHAEDLDRALHACLTIPIQFRDHLCCGNGAAVDFLLEAGSRLNRDDLTQAARHLLSRMAQRKGGDYAYMPQTYQPAFSPSLFYGAAGVGYELLRAIHPALPSILI